MCGIAGLVGEFVPGLVSRMNAIQKHRGPDGQGVFEGPEAQVALGHVRLFILDLTPAAAQLMHSPDGRFVLVYPGLRREPSFEALQEHLARSHASGTHTALKGIFRLGPGMMLKWKSSNKSLQIKPYWRPDFSQNSEKTYSETIELLRSSVQAAVKRQMISDVPVGSFLSGGLDSRLITLLAVEHAEKDFQCFLFPDCFLDSCFRRNDEEEEMGSQVDLKSTCFRNPSPSRRG
jgi:asparagine synthetase B (glutamine-hydrolysing)